MMTKLSERMLHLRKQKNLQQKTLAEILGKSVREYQRYEHGEHEPTASSIIALAQFYGVTSDYLLGLSDEESGE
mgnify:CR=1 FL=1